MADYYLKYQKYKNKYLKMKQHVNNINGGANEYNSQYEPVSNSQYELVSNKRTRDDEDDLFSTFFTEYGNFIKIFNNIKNNELDTSFFIEPTLMGNYNNINTPLIIAIDTRSPMLLNNPERMSNLNIIDYPTSKPIIKGTMLKSKLTNEISSKILFNDEIIDKNFFFQYLIINTFTNKINNFIIKLVEDVKINHNNIMNQLLPGIFENTNDLIEFIENDMVKFIYKGGTIMKLIFNTDTIKHDNDRRKKYKKIFSDNFKRSDSDYSIIINDILPYNHFNFIYQHMNKISYTVLINIRDVFESQMINNDGILEINNLNKNRMNKLVNLLNENDGTNDVGNIICLIACNGMYGMPSDEFKGNSKIQNIISGSNDYRRSLTQLSDVIITANIDDINNVITPYLYKMNSEKKNSIYYSYNEINRYNNLYNNTTEFALHRLKLNFTAIVKVDEKDDITEMNLQSELVDVSIPKISNFNKINFNKHLKEYSFVKRDFRFGYNKLNFISYSNNGFIHDLCITLFKSLEPYFWNENKYIKRINRLAYFVRCELINLFKKYTSDTISMNVIKRVIYKISSLYKNSTLQNILYDEEILPESQIVQNGDIDEIMILYYYFKNTIKLLYDQEVASNTASGFYLVDANKSPSMHSYYIFMFCKSIYDFFLLPLFLRDKTKVITPFDKSLDSYISTNFRDEINDIIIESRELKIINNIEPYQLMYLKKYYKY